jgi:iron(III) transport system substrate-binding protein
MLRADRCAASPHRHHHIITEKTMRDNKPGRRRFLKTTLAAGAVTGAASLGITGSAFAQSTSGRSVAEVASLEGNDRQQILIEGAKKEGELTVYFSNPGMVPVAEAFGKKYGIKVKTWRSESSSILQRVTSEAAGGRNEVDAILNNAPEMEALHREKLLQIVKSPYLKDLMPEAIQKHKEWTGTTIEMFVQAYNTKKIKKEDLPKSYQDLLDPKWKGMLGIETSDYDWFAYVLQEIGQEKGIKLFNDIVAANGISLRKGHSLLGQMVSSGDVPLAMNLYSWGPDELKKKGAPIERFNISQPIAMFTGLGVVKKAPHPHTAVLFYDYMLSDGQGLQSEQFKIASNNKYDAEAKKIPMKFIDPGLFLDNYDKWRKNFDSIFRAV